MLSPVGPIGFTEQPLPGQVFRQPSNFGGAMANCDVAFRMIAAAEANGSLPFFPDYNLDGDRGYAWPCWDVADPPLPGASTFDRLDPEGNVHITVNPVLIL